jgi:hypothetical protein
MFCLLLCSSTCCLSFSYHLFNLFSHSHSLSAELHQPLPYHKLPTSWSCHQSPPSISSRIQNCKSYPFFASFLLTAYHIIALPCPLSPPAPSRGIQNLHSTFSHPRGTFSLSRTFAVLSRTLSHLHSTFPHPLAPSRHLAPSHTFVAPSR